MKILSIVVINLFLIIYTQTYASSDLHIVSMSNTVANLQFDESTFSDGYETTLAGAVGYDYAFKHGFQFGGNLSFSIFSGGSLWVVGLGPTYNFNEEIENSFFIGMKGGLVNYHIDRAMGYEDSFVSAEFGKRFKVFEHISYTPDIAIMKILDENSADPTFTINILKFSILF